jgi:hypothetical protein
VRETLRQTVAQESKQSFDMLAAELRALQGLPAA